MELVKKTKERIYGGSERGRKLADVREEDVQVVIRWRKMIGCARHPPEGNGSN